MKVIVWIDHGQVRVIDVSQYAGQIDLFQRVNKIFTDECVGIEAFNGSRLNDFVKYVKDKAGDWEAFEVFELAEVE